VTEWGVIGVIVALVGLFMTVVKPVVNLTKTITRLTVVVDRLDKGMDAQRNDAHDAHKRLWEHNETQDKRLDDHEQRIGQLEGK